MFTVSSCLEQDTTRFALIDVHHCDHCLGVGQTLDEGRDVWGKPWSPANWVVITDAAVQGTAAMTRMKPSHRELNEYTHFGGAIHHRIVGQPGVGRGVVRVHGGHFSLERAEFSS